MFHYEERLLMSKRFGWMQAGLGIGAIAGFNFLIDQSFGRRLIRRLGPKQGEGPSERNRREGHFRGELLASSKGNSRYRVRIERNGDPGNDVTIALAWAATRLALENAFESEVKGFLTPSVAFGDGLKPALEREGFTIQTEAL